MLIDTQLVSYTWLEKLDENNKRKCVENIETENHNHSWRIMLYYIGVKRNRPEGNGTMANYRGIPEIEYIYHGAWSDPELIYDGKSFNYWDIDDALWSQFCEMIEEDTGTTVYEIEQNMDKYEPMFNEYVQDIATSYLDDCILNGYFND